MWQSGCARLAWPQPGDWCALLGAAHLAGAEAGLWLVIDTNTGGRLTVVDGAARWTARQIIAAEALWLPTTGQIKVWLRANGYAISSLEGDLPPVSSPTGGGNRPAWASSLLPTAAPPPAPTAPSPMRHLCRALRPGSAPIEARALTEAEAVAGVALSVLALNHTAW
jgi:hypothetical protein